MTLEPIGRGHSIYVSQRHRFGTDAFLLADFAQAERAKKVCDFCSGCGIIAFLLKKKNSMLCVDALEIQPEAAALCRKTASEFSEFTGVNTVEGDLFRTAGTLPGGSYDLITCNPPYKETGKGIASREETDLFARHEASCTLERIVIAASRLLKNGGRLCLCGRPERLCDYIFQMRMCKIEPKRLRFVYNKVTKEPWLFLIEGVRCGGVFMHVMPPMVLYDKNGNHTEEYKRIYDYEKV